MANNRLEAAFVVRLLLRRLGVLAALSFSLLAAAQDNGVLAIAPAAKVSARRGSTVTQKLEVEVRSGFHVNSNAPEDEFLIPLKLTWNKGSLEAAEVVYPKATHEKYAFSEKPISVFTGKFEIVTRFKVPEAAGDMGVMTGKLRYQACTEKECLAPKTVPVQFSLGVH